MKKMKTEKKITTINLPVDLHDEIAAAAEREHRSFSGQVVFFLANRVVRHTNRKQPVA